jgi:hypothetical protein
MPLNKGGTAQVIGAVGRRMYAITDGIGAGQAQLANPDWKPWVISSAPS